MWICVTVHRLLSRKVFWHVYAKIPGHTGQNAITEGDLEYILIRLLFRRHFPKLMQTEKAVVLGVLVFVGFHL